ncbi:peptidoglycan binding domain-containing protein [Clostridium sp. A1-XYC3]|uniref:Peptidoglycan binding domain-containing protein n=1 Tax=Clostridium tanneri TaxID=3037988 RepID=A0ABU4JXS6_9CLOT|nr:peptidoglycan binding domain-containing protein [Clostridium sp. A1-XYC3]MDW8802917.1 peptidoglycan binding domain-containing protein [Clostridium sp. A1-XYC3]
MRKKRNKHMSDKKKIIVGLSALAFMYLAATIFFANHFFFRSQINGIDVSLKTTKQAEEKIISVISKYSLEIEGQDGIKGKINGKEIGLAINEGNKIKEFKSKQDSFKWISSIFNKNHEQIEGLITFDKELLKEKLNKENFFSSKEVNEPKDVSFEYSDNGYKMIPEVNGNKIKKEAVYESVQNAILNQNNLLNLEQANCYEKPKYTSKSKEAKEAMELLNKYTNLKVTYNFGSNEEILDGSTINKWLYVDENMKVGFNEKKVRTYVDSLAVKYNTFGETRKFAASTGKIVQVDGGNYGWVISKAEEVKSLIEVIKKGKDAKKEPIYSQKAVSHDKNDIGSTYVEINLTRQHMWFYKNGALVTEGDIVTGNTSANFGTPAGTYVLNYKERNATLKGEGYSSPVDFWMPFNGNIGIHDATWRTEFGKDIYVKSGSHGCINSPYYLANAIYDNITPGTPIVCYTE